jgi:hypothetical protein
MWILVGKPKAPVDLECKGERAGSRLKPNGLHRVCTHNEPFLPCHNDAQETFREVELDCCWDNQLTGEIRNCICIYLKTDGFGEADCDVLGI